MNKPAPKPAPGTPSRPSIGVTKKPIPGVPTPNANRPVPLPVKPGTVKKQPIKPSTSDRDAKLKAIADFKETARKADESRQIVRPAKP
jgi:hypothetical protein